MNDAREWKGVWEWGSLSVSQAVSQNQIVRMAMMMTMMVIKFGVNERLLEEYDDDDGQAIIAIGVKMTAMLVNWRLWIEAKGEEVRVDEKSFK